MKRGKGGLMAFLAAGVLMVNVVPAVAESIGWGDVPSWLLLIMTAADKLDNGEGGGDRIRCYSAGTTEGHARYVDCSTCKSVQGVRDEGSKSKCTTN